MKKTLTHLLFIFLMSISFEGITQNTWGIHFTPLVSNTFHENVNTKPNLGSFSTGWFYEYLLQKKYKKPKLIILDGDTTYKKPNIKNRNTIIGKLNYKQKCFSYRGSDESLIGQSRLSYLSLGFYYNFETPISERFNFQFSLGSDLDYLIKTDGIICSTNAENNSSSLNKKEYYNNFVISPSVEIGIEYKFQKGKIGHFYFHRWVQLFTSLSIQHSATSLTKQNTEITKEFFTINEIETKGLRSLDYGITVGLIYLLHRPDRYGGVRY